jgi:molybdopterin/thiamine biosynthesis adenylyltransferase
MLPGRPSRSMSSAFLFCGSARSGNTDIVLVREWRPIPVSAMVKGSRRYGLEWTSAFSSEILAQAIRLNAAVVLVHSHGRVDRPELSGPDKESARRLFPKFSRILAKPCASIVIGHRGASGLFWKLGRRHVDLTRVRIVGAPIIYWSPTFEETTPKGTPKLRHDRMRLAIGPNAEPKLNAASVAVIGLCGGGSHVCQQLAHMGIGRLIPIDGELVAEVNLGRMVGSTQTDVDKVTKTDVMVRLINSIDAGITVEPVPFEFPEPVVIDALKTADVVVSCVDSFLVREQINTFCRRHHLPLVDIGLGILTKNERLIRADGQLTVALPDTACLRCGQLLTDEVLDRERREHPPGYDRDPNAPGDAQVVSMNGTLASEAANTVLDLITGYSGGRRRAGWWQYNGRDGSLFPLTEPPKRRVGCPACAEQGHGDPPQL